ncbi:MAG: tetratricopeptide repeat protein, partial [Zetaproteobacteria bacterium]|nr:tetratricopeptide repeat protein [Zetaproteobacteria bacterium]
MKVLQIYSSIFLVCLISYGIAHGQSSITAVDATNIRQKHLSLELREWTNPVHSYNRAVADYQLENWKAAAQGFRSATTTKDPQLQEKSWFNLGNSSARQKDWDAAILAYKKVLQLSPQNHLAQENLAWAEQMKSHEPQQSQNEPQQSQNEPQQSQNEPQQSQNEPQQSQNEPQQSQNEPQQS